MTPDWEEVSLHQVLFLSPVRGAGLEGKGSEQSMALLSHVCWAQDWPALEEQLGNRMMTFESNQRVLRSAHMWLRVLLKEGNI